MHNLGHCCTAVQHLSVRLGRREVLTDVNFSLHCGELTAVIGRNGAGKTTLLRALLGQIPFSGDVGFRDHNGAPKRLHLGYVPQRTELDAGSPATVYDLCAAYLSKKPVFLFRDNKLAREIQAHLESFGAESLLGRKIADLSGGEWQRVMLSLATHPVPELLILDEPASGIDQQGLEVFYGKLEQLKTEHDLSILLVSHDFSALPRYADKLILLDGSVRAIGSPPKVFQSAAFRDLFGEVRYV